MLSNGKWKDYESIFDYEHRTIMLFDQSKFKIKSLQLGNPNKLSLEFNVHIQWYSHSDIHQTHSKWACLILNHTWHFRTIDYGDRDDLSTCISANESKKTYIYIYIYIYREFNSFHVIWKDLDNRTHKESLNPYSITLKQGMQYVKDKLQMRNHFINGGDEVLYFQCEFHKWSPEISSTILNKDVLLYDIYKYLPHYPIIQVHWEIKGYFIVPYKRTIGIERSNLPKSVQFQDMIISSNKKPRFNPLLYECDLHKLKIIRDTIYVKITRNSPLQKLFHEMIKNGYLCDLITFQYANNKKEEKQFYDSIKQEINYSEKDENGKLILNDKILTILNELKILYHDDIHKQMGYPLQLHHICAILLYCGKSCNTEFSYDQIQFRHHRWPYLDRFLQESIMILHSHERREESETELYCGLKGVRLKNIEKEIKAGNFISHVSTSDDIQVARMYRSDQGYEKTHKEECAWNAKVESEDEYTQMILLTW
ncbi:hypothetical protein RFI_40141, partial [Reticulomyxa filosa]